jgi:cysteinyl-tRNA synthetase
MLPFIRRNKKAPSKPPLRLHNTLSGTTERFEPLGRTVKMYGCGPTAYDEQHVGNLFPPVVANVLHRTLSAWGYTVKEVNNITDFGHLSEDAASEDKMTKGLRREGLELSLENMRAVAEKYAQLFFEDLPKLGVDIAAVEYPRASDYVPKQIAIVQSLVEKGYAYPTHDGVYFDTSRYEGYGKLGGVDIAGQMAGARVAVGQDKRHPNDFALWKKDDKLGWESPWGRGFPGWHTECVAMIFSLLGQQIDIHMGGSDLIPIHHNNELAQAESLTRKQYVRYWVHNAHITVEGKKISKSLGNTIYLRHLEDRGLSPRALRYWFLTGHYRTPMNFTWDAIGGAATALRRLGQTYLELPEGEVNSEFMREFYERVADDLNTPMALALVWARLKDLNKATLRACDEMLGLGLSDARPSAKLEIKREELPVGIKQLIEAREAARQNKDFTKADEFRAEIESAGYELKDTSSGLQITKK